jgi:ribosomal protein S27E
MKLVRAILIRNHHKVNMLATEGYCVKCKAKRAMKGEQQVVMKNGRPATKGTCSVCGTKMFKIGGGPSKTVKKVKAKPKPRSKAKPKPRSKAKPKPRSKAKPKPR